MEAVAPKKRERVLLNARHIDVVGAMLDQQAERRPAFDALQQAALNLYPIELTPI